MTNLEKILKNEASIDEIAKEFQNFVLEHSNIEPHTYENEMKEFLRAECKPTLTEDERVILRNITYDSEYKYIYRSLGMLYLSEKKGFTCVDRLPAMHHLFQFIKERRRI